MTITVDAPRLTMTAEDYILLTGHGFTRDDQMQQMLRLLPYVETMTEASGTHIRALDVDVHDLKHGDDIPDHDRLGHVWGLMDKLKQALGGDAISGRLTRGGKYRVTAEITPSATAEQLSDVADVVSLYNMGSVN